MLQKKKASEIIQKELGLNFTPMQKISRHDYIAKSLRLRNREIDIPQRMQDVSASMMLVGTGENEQMFKAEEQAKRRSSFEDINDINTFSNSVIRQDDTL
jgi:hypothetical protein